MAAEGRAVPRNAGYTRFGGVFHRLLRSRGRNQSTFAAERRRRGLRLGRPGRERDVGQRSVSDWMRGGVACPREVPSIAAALLDLSEDEWTQLGLAFAYGQTVPEGDPLRPSAGSRPPRPG